MKAVRNTLRDHAGLLKGDRLVVAVSGGVDSIVLLHALGRIADESGCELIVAHLDHRIRSDSAEDGAFVKQAAERIGVPFVGGQADVPCWRVWLGRNTESTGHELRLAFLRAVAAQHGARYVCLGHSATDRAETLLMHLTRGSGPDGLACMPARSGMILRPLIDVDRGEILRYADAHRLTWREDATNHDVSLTRNRVRHCIAPHLAAINPRWVDAFSRASRDVAAQARLIDATLDSWWHSLCIEDRPNCVSLDLQVYRTLPHELRVPALRRMVQRLFGSCRGWDRIHFEAMLRQAERACGSIDLPGCRWIVAHSALRLNRSADSDSVSVHCGFPPCRVVWGDNAFDDPRLSITVRQVDDPAAWIESARDTDTVEVADADRIVPPLTLRPRRPGDRFRPLGMSCEKRLKAFFIDEHVPAEKRAAWPLLCDRNGIVWVTRLRLSDTVRLTPETTRFAVLRVEDRR